MLFTKKQLSLLKIYDSRSLDLLDYSAKKVVVMITFIDEFHTPFIMPATVSYCRMLCSDNRVSDILVSKIVYLLH